MITLRDYQDDLYHRIRAGFKAGNRSLLAVSPTGSGKTVLFSYLSQRVVQAGNRVLCMAHRAELVEQMSNTFDGFKIAHGIIKAGITPNSMMQAQVGMVQTIARRLEKIKAPDFIICDEAHHMAASQYKAIIDAFPRARVLGVTATPCRLDGKGLGDYFNDIVMGPTVSELMDRGFLSRCKYFAPPSGVDYSGVKKRAGDYASNEAEKVMDKACITGCAIDHYQKIGRGLPAIAFCVSVDHAKHVAEQFNAAGIPSACIHGDLDPVVRKGIVTALSNGTIKVMTSCQLVTEGFDVPKVGVAIMLRKTASLAMHLQMVGRILRPFEGKEYSIVIDHVGNCLPSSHGLAEDAREWSLDGIEKKKKGQKNEPATHIQCKGCYCMHAKELTACPECGHVDEKRIRELKQIEGELVELNAIREAPLHLALHDVRSRADLQKIAKAKAYKPGWVWHQAKKMGLTR